MDKEVYSQIINTMDLLNKSIALQDKKNVQLFSYLYNKYIDMDNQFTYTLSNNTQIISNQISDLDKRFQTMELRLGKIDKKLDKIISFINDNSKNNIIMVEQKPSWIKVQLIRICNFFKKVYNSCYNFIFRRKIKKQLLEEQRKKQESEREKLLKKKQQIKNILSKTK